jgi:hypothetical protein
MSRQRSARLGVWLGMSAFLLVPCSVRAFEDVELFTEQAAQGGGGARYFTGSPADPYTCKVCHQNGKSPAAQVSGLPLSGYLPGQAYEITIDWSDTLEHVAAAAEITDMQGRRAGRVRLPGRAEQKDPELCEDQPVRAAQLLSVAPDADGEACAGDAQELPDECRAVIHSRSCGAQRLRFLWTAPTSENGPLWFAGVVVAGDGDGTSDADGVSELGSVIAASSKARSLKVSTGCSVLPNSLGHASWCSMLVAAAAGWFAGRRKRRARHAKIGCSPKIER